MSLLSPPLGDIPSSTPVKGDHAPGDTPPPVRVLLGWCHWRRTDSDTLDCAAAGILGDVGWMGGDERRGPLVPGSVQRGVRSADRMRHTCTVSEPVHPVHRLNSIDSLSRQNR